MRDLTNFREETIDVLTEHNKTVDDIVWFGTSDGKKHTTWEEVSSSLDFEYYRGFGSNEISLDLVIVGDNWWMERHEYDGSEWWEFKSIPKRTTNVFKSEINLLKTN